MIHYTLTGYMISTAIIMIVCVIAYRLLMENKVRPVFNRLMLLFIYILAFLLPLLVSFIPQTPGEIAIEIGAIETVGVITDFREGANVNNFEIANFFQWVSRIYIIGTVLMFLFSVISVVHLFQLLRNAITINVSGTKVYVHKNKKLSCFSWCNRIFLYEKAIKSEINDLGMLICHEKAHLDRRHWIDLILAQIVIIFQWFNPAAWFIRKELQRIHEYEADEIVLQSGIDEKDYQMLLIQNISGNRYSGLTDGLNNCSLKKRIIMMKKTKFKKDWVARGIIVCGFAVLGGLIIHIPAVASVLDNVKPLNAASDNVASKNINHEDLRNEKDRDTVIHYYGHPGETREDKVEDTDSDNSKEVMIDKSSEEPQAKTVTKNSKDGENIDKKDFSSDKKKGSLENYPDAYLAVDKPAEYEGGETQLLKDLITTIQYPEEAKELNIQGRVVVRFQINTNGTISNCRVAYSQNPILNEAAVKAVENLPGKWEPGEVDGKPVASVFNMPVTFKLQPSQEESK